MSSLDFENLVCLVGPAVNKKSTNFGSAITLMECMAITLEILCNWVLISQHNIPVYKVSTQSVSLIIPEGCEAQTLWMRM
jgi:hypothetical protein